MFIVKTNLPQPSCSSELSVQSSLPLHSREPSIHCPLLHVNSLSSHPINNNSDARSNLLYRIVQTTLYYDSVGTLVVNVSHNVIAFKYNVAVLIQLQLIIS